MSKRTYKLVVSSNENGVYKRKIVKYDLGYYDAKFYTLLYETFGFSCTIITTKREPIS